MSDTMELDVWEGEWGLPSVDLKCLQAMTLAKISHAELKINPTNNPFKTPRGMLPVFKCGKTVLDDFQDIASYLRRNNYNSDYGLSTTECADIIAYTHMLQEKLLPVIQYTWWIDAKNYTEFTRPWYAKALPFPLNFYYPGRYEKDAKSMIEAMFDIDDLAVIEAALFSKAEICLNALSIRLGDNDYFFAQPSSLDATVYAYLAPILKCPFPSTVLQQHLKNCNNLVAYVSRMSRRYFSEYIVPPKEKPKLIGDPSAKDEDTDFPYKRRNQLLAGIFATAAMVAYAFLTGLVSVTKKSIAHNDDRSDGYQDIFEHAEEGDEN
ncbi:hypothetical protein J437_LFUL015745 [Ladona fulva]|uniref:Metaxin n=1 Tax=Ladona fulva TaxID=123851 RepID=A0A8K0KKG2_LADFU|nr:hypothetical protein J437_LFUL015745 [Ladona fulva]